MYNNNNNNTRGDELRGKATVKDTLAMRYLFCCSFQLSDNMHIMVITDAVCISMERVIDISLLLYKRSRETE